MIFSKVPSLLATAALLLSSAQVHAQSAESALRPGDSIVIRISGVPAEEVTNFASSFSIGDNGNVNLPFIGEVRAAGKRPSTLQKDIESAYRTAEIYTHPTIQVSANMTDGTSTQVLFVSGEVKTPNRYTLSPGMNVGTAITTAGGFTDFADPKHVKLIRNGRAVELDCRRADSPGSLTPVQPGDQITVSQ